MVRSTERTIDNQDGVYLLNFITFVTDKDLDQILLCRANLWAAKRSTKQRSKHAEVEQTRQ